eukprot:TRINITY_DN1067_c1_g3_i1.p1 TRINITY_DN1067_c1_g3~~TRINITY_DN1067_c1_g3_i1.p1  ORF type:complete len:260 (-),score=65.79 TRINITY_DN1067_c1_g3_i1:94-873(-)
MQVKVKDLKGVVTEFDGLPDNPSVLDLKVRVQERLDVPQEVQRLIYSGKELTDNALLLSDFGIKDGTTVHLVVRKPPKSSSPVAGAPTTPDIVVSPGAAVNAVGVPQQQQQHQQQEDYAQLQGHAVFDVNEIVFDAIRMSRTVKIITLVEMVELFAFARATMAIGVFFLALLALSGLIGAETMKYKMIVPFMLLQFLNVAMTYLILMPSVWGIILVVLNSAFSSWVIWVCVKFIRLLLRLNPEEVGDARAIQSLHQNAQ